MSGTAFGVLVLHGSPGASGGGPLALVQTGLRECAMPVRTPGAPVDGPGCERLIVCR
jgi:hypothetical protein